MKKKIIKFVSFQAGVDFNDILCAVHFIDEEGKDYYWIPKWADVRNIYGTAVARECMWYGNDTPEVRKFLTQCSDIPKRIKDYPFLNKRGENGERCRRGN